MRLGILADIHEDVDRLRKAVEVLDGADQFVVLGDIFDHGERIDETVSVLRDVGAVGVYGNHELGFCHEPRSRLLARYTPEVIEFFASLQAAFEVDDVLFTHGLPTWDATDPATYYLSEKPWQLAPPGQSFAGFAQRLFLVGHFHRWYATIAEWQLSWAGNEVLEMDPDEGCLVVVHAVMDGWCAMLDTAANQLVPHRIEG